MYPHEYYDYHGNPHLHNVGEGRPYLENDYHANDMGPQLPGLSTIGRGPRGEGLEVGNVVENESTSSFALFSDLTGELLWQSPNLAPAVLEFISTPAAQVAAGVPAPLTIRQTKGGVPHTTTAYLPAGEQGSRIYTAADPVAYSANSVYSIPVASLVTYGHSYSNAPTPRVNDVAMFKIENNGTKLAIGNIVSVSHGAATIVARIIL